MAANKDNRLDDPYIEGLTRGARKLNGQEPPDIVKKVYGFTIPHIISGALFLISLSAATTKVLLKLDDLEKAVNLGSEFQKEMIVFQRKQVCYNKVFLDFQQYGTRYHGQCEAP
jgi:hypothetical protein